MATFRPKSCPTWISLEVDTIARNRQRAWKFAEVYDALTYSLHLMLPHGFRRMFAQETRKAYGIRDQIGLQHGKQVVGCRSKWEGIGATNL